MSDWEIKQMNTMLTVTLSPDQRSARTVTI